jgi:hypothetical protein
MNPEPIMQFFTYAHLPPHLQAVSKPFAEMAQTIVSTLPRNPERTVALRKLMEAKDCAVRALIFKDEPDLLDLKPEAEQKAKEISQALGFRRMVPYTPIALSLDGLLMLDALEDQKRKDSPEADKIRDMLDGSWKQLSDSERSLLGKVSAALIEARKRSPSRSFKT